MTKNKEKAKPPTWEDLEARGEAPWKSCPPEDSQPPYPGPQVLYGQLLGFYLTWGYHPDPRVYHVLTAWTLHTWHYRKLRASAPVQLLGPIGSGKTTILEILEEVAYRGVRGGSMSVSNMFRLNEAVGPSFLLDESQTYNREDQAEAQAFLNERYRKGGKVWRVEKTENGFMPTFYAAYGPTALAGSSPAWEGMASRAIVVNMEKGRPAERTLTVLFFAEGAKFRVWLRRYSETFDPHKPRIPDEGESPVYDSAMEKLIADGKIERGEPDHFPRFDFSVFEDGRVQEKAETLIPFAPRGEPRDMIVSFCLDLQRRQMANENTSYLVEYFQAYLSCQPENGKVSAKAVRAQIAIFRGCSMNDKGMPGSRFVMSSLETLGFERTRMGDGSTGVIFNPDLQTRLAARYSLSASSETPVSSDQERFSSSRSEESEDTEDSRRPSHYRENPDVKEVAQSKNPCEICGRQGVPVIRIGESSTRFFCNEHLAGYKGDL